MNLAGLQLVCDCTIMLNTLFQTLSSEVVWWNRLISHQRIHTLPFLVCVVPYQLMLMRLDHRYAPITTVRLAFCYLVLLRLQDGYGTCVGEGSGTTLSQQNLLRVVLARCLLRKPQVQ